MLIEKLQAVDFLEKEAWAGLNKNLESYGLSEGDLAHFKSSLIVRISNISESLQIGNYKFGKTRASVIPKVNGDYRPLQIPEIKDRVVLKGLAIILEEELKGLLKESEGFSFAYQRGLGVHCAVKKVKEYYDKGYKYILEADIEKFFPSVNKGKLLEIIFKTLPDSSLNTLISEGISQELGGLENISPQHHHLFDDSDKGVPQGNPLSPLFSNIFLAPFDSKMKEKSFALIRYADDFVVMCKTKREAEDAYKEAKEILEGELGLKLHELTNEPNAKTKIVNPESEVFSFLSVTFDGKNLFPSKKSVERFIMSIEKTCNARKEAEDVYTLLMTLKYSIEGWVSTYFYTDVERYFEEIDTTINQQSLLGLKRLGWKLSNKSIGKVAYKYRKKNDNGVLDSGHCLSIIQRRKSGVPFCNDILELRRK